MSDDPQVCTLVIPADISFLCQVGLLGFLQSLFMPPQQGEHGRPVQQEIGSKATHVPQVDLLKHAAGHGKDLLEVTVRLIDAVEVEETVDDPCKRMHRMIRIIWLILAIDIDLPEADDCLTIVPDEFQAVPEPEPCMDIFRTRRILHLYSAPEQYRRISEP